MTEPRHLALKPYDCPKCGQVHPRGCHGHGKTSKKPCGHYPMVGQDVCRMHGGGAPQARAAARARLMDARVKRQLAQLDVPPVTDPLTELGRLAGEVVAFKNELAGLVNQLHGDPVVCAECGHETPSFGELRYEDHRGMEQLRSEVALWERALDRCVTVLGVMARLNIDERLAAVTEKQAAMFMSAMDAALDAVGVPRDQRPEAKKAAARHLRVVS